MKNVRLVMNYKGMCLHFQFRGRDVGSERYFYSSTVFFGPGFTAMAMAMLSR